jgi:hypothetical protein
VPAPAGAVAPAARGGQLSSRRLALTAERTFALPPGPRPLRGETKKLMKDSTPSSMRLMYASEKAEDYWSLSSLAGLLFFSAITVGILPAVFASIAASRRQRVKRFFREGTAAIAEVIKTEPHDMGFGEKLTRVSYAFEADGLTHRDSDTVLPVIGSLLQPGDKVPVLYIADRDYDSIIVVVE